MSETSTGTRLPSGGKRLGMERSEWLNDWFMSFSPRNSNSNAEGPWDHWADLAVQILRHPATAVTWPDAHAAVQHLEPRNFYAEAGRPLTEAECDELFGDHR